MAMELNQNNSDIIKKRFERDAAAFDAIYQSKKSEFSGWFNRTFRKPIFERHDIAFQVMGDLHHKSVLDVGCGSGVYSTECAVKGASRVKGIDFSFSMLEIARQRAKMHAADTICEFELNDFLKMDLSETFDYSIAMGVFDYLTDPLPFLSRLKLVTKNKIIASFPGHSLFREPLRQLRYFLTAKGRVYFYDANDIQQLANQVGFHRIEIRHMKTGSGYVLIADV